MTASRVRLPISLAVSIAVAALAASPVRADTQGDLDAARHRLAAVQANLDRLASAYAAAEAAFARTEADIADTRAKIDRVTRAVANIQGQLASRARVAYESGGGGTLELLLSSSSFSEFSNRFEFLGSIARGDNDLVLQAQRTNEELRRQQEALSTLSKEQAANVQALSSQKAAIAAAFEEQQRLVGELQRKLASEKAAAARAAAAAAIQEASGGGGTVVSGHGALQSCPVGQPRAFGDDFGAPRPGGRTHQGIDLLAPYGTPIYAAQSGRFEQNYNSLGGTSALVYADDGDYTYYAHMSSYAGIGNGAHVSAGTMIGHVGNTGDAAGGPYHLHFEYHPGGGGAIDPYSMLVAVCG